MPKVSMFALQSHVKVKSKELRFDGLTGRVVAHIQQGADYDHLVAFDKPVLEDPKDQEAIGSMHMGNLDSVGAWQKARDNMGKATGPHHFFPGSALEEIE